MSTAQVRLPPMMTVAEFIEWPGDGTPTRYELVDGVLRAMAPGSDAHNSTISNVVGLLWQHLRQNGSKCRVVAAPGVQPRVRADWNFRIPDVGVTCSPNLPGQVMTPDPVLLCEVLSPSNAPDTWENVRAYTTLPSLRDILVVQSAKMAVEVLTRNSDGEWPRNPTMIQAGGSVRLESIGAEFPIADIYAGTHLLTQQT